MSMMKIKNNTTFRVVGDKWSMWVPEGVTIHVFISADGKDGHFSEIGSKSLIQGPDTFQCCGFNEGSSFRVTGIGDRVLEVLV